MHCVCGCVHVCDIGIGNCVCVCACESIHFFVVVIGLARIGGNSAAVAGGADRLTRSNSRNIFIVYQTTSISVSLDKSIAMCAFVCGHIFFSSLKLLRNQFW